MFVGKFLLHGLMQVAIASVIQASRSAPMVRGGIDQESNVTCRVTLVDTLFQVDSTSSIRSIMSSHCIPIMDDRETDDLLPIVLPEKIMSNHHDDIHKGKLYISIQGAVMRRNELIVPKGAHFTIIESPPEHLRRLHQRHLNALGTKTLAVVRISTSDSSPSVSISSLLSTLVGTDIGLKTQYEACSFQQMQWHLSPFGIQDVTVSKPVSSFSSAMELITAAQDQLKASMGLTGVSEIADKVIMCLPPGTGNWVGSAGVGHWRAQLNNDWCLSLTATMHEIGHTLGLAHSNRDGVAYADPTGYMAAGHKSSSWPRKCFNGYNYMSLGWYQSRWLNFDPTIEGAPRLIQLATFVDFNSASTDQPVLVIVSNDYYLVYNRAKGFNADTEAMQDTVTVTQPDSTGTENRAGLTAGQSFTVSNYRSSGRSLLIEVCARRDGQPDLMWISVGMGTSACGQPLPASVAAPTPRPTRKPTPQPTRKPTRKPTPNPSPRPTRKPTPQPTRKPTPRPTRLPTRGPTHKPTLRPTRKPSSLPTSIPTPNPSRLPTSRPTSRPTSLPTRLPTGKPTSRPTRKPSSWPTLQPSSRPTPNPTPRPTTMPSSRPTRKPTPRPTKSRTGRPTKPPTLKSSQITSGIPTGTPTSTPIAVPSLSTESALPSTVITDGPVASPVRTTHPVSSPVQIVPPSDGGNSNIFSTTSPTAFIGGLAKVPATGPASAPVELVPPRASDYGSTPQTTSPTALIGGRAVVPPTFQAGSGSTDAKISSGPSSSIAPSTSESPSRSSAQTVTPTPTFTPTLQGWASLEASNSLPAKREYIQDFPNRLHKLVDTLLHD